jgi:hypothetical protein
MTHANWNAKDDPNSALTNSSPRKMSASGYKHIVYFHINDVVVLNDKLAATESKADSGPEDEDITI